MPVSQDKRIKEVRKCIYLLNHDFNPDAISNCYDLTLELLGKINAIGSW